MDQQRRVDGPTKNTSHSETHNRFFRPPTVRSLAISAFLVFGLSACGGAIDTMQSMVRSTPESEFIGAVAADEEQIPEALAEVATETSTQTTGSLQVDSPASPPNAFGNHAVLSDGRIFLRGAVPSSEVADMTVLAFERVLGGGNVIAEYVIDETATFDAEEAQSVFLAENVLFETGSAEISEDFDSVLDFSPLLLQVQPEATLWIIGHTDSEGNDAANLALSENRVEAVRDWIVERGGDNDRIFTSGEGEASPAADNSTEEGRTLNRRVEFILAGFDIGL